MNSIGIICEYNPFHKGHAYQLQEIHNQYPEHIRIAIMSGAFVQRGEPAYFSKFDRARWAILGGADVVIELPTIYALGSAEMFSTGAVRLMKAFNIETISFGSELPSLAPLLEAAHLLNSVRGQELIKEEIKKGTSYGTALRQVLRRETTDGAHICTAPNAILGLEYIRSALQYHPTLQYVPVQRHSNHHATSLDSQPSSTTNVQTLPSDKLADTRSLEHVSQEVHSNEALQILPSGTALRQVPSNEALQTLPSGTALRQALSKGHRVENFVPSTVWADMNQVISSGKFTDYNRYEMMLHGIHRLTSIQTLETIADFTEGIEHRWHSMVAKPTWADVINAIKTKRYPYARLQRMSAYTALGITKELYTRAMHQGPQYGRLLAFNDRGRQWLKSVQPNVPLLQKWAKAPNQVSPLGCELLHIDELATDLQALAFTSEIGRSGHQDYTYSPQYIK